MSGYQPSELILATHEGPALPVLTATLQHLVHEHGATADDCYVIANPADPDALEHCWEHLEPTDVRMAEALDLGFGVRLDIKLRVGRSRHLAMLCIVPAGEGRVSVTIKLDSSVIDAVYAYDRSMEDFDDEAKRGLLALCIGLTRAVGAPAFLLQRDGDRISPLTTQEITEQMSERTRDWHICGAAQALVPLQMLRKQEGATDYRCIYASVTGLTIYDLVHPVKY